MPRINAMKHKYIGKTVKHWMVDADVKPTELAMALGMSRQNLYYKIQHNSFGYEDLLTIIEVCKLSDEEIVRCFRR